MISAKDIHKRYNSLEVLKGVSLEVKKGEIVSIVGASGAGKTTLLQILGTLDRADNGEVKINDTNLRALSERKLSDFRNKEIGFVFQFHHLLPEFTALENVCLPAFIAGKSKSEAEAKANELLNFLGLTERAHHKPSELSGGERRKVTIARAYVIEPIILLADEPASHMDTITAEYIMKILLDINRSGTSIVFTTSNLSFVEKVGKRLIRI